MDIQILLFAAYTCLLFLVLSHETCNAHENHHCPPSSCGSINNISFPFWLKQNPQNCGDSRYNLSCENNLTVLYLYSGKYYVQAINYNNYTIRVVDADLQKDNCSSIPRYSLTERNFSNRDPYGWSQYRWQGYDQLRASISETLAFITCTNPVNSPFYVDTAPCINGTIYSSDSSATHMKRHSYVMDGATNASDVEYLCKLELLFMTSSLGKEKTNMSFIGIHNELVHGFELSWLQVLCDNCSKENCYLDDADNFHCDDNYGGPSSMTINQFLKIIAESLRFAVYYIGDIFKYPLKIYPWTGASISISVKKYLLSGPSSVMAGVTIRLRLAITVFGTPCVVAFLIYKWRRRHISIYDTIEEFLRSHNNLMPIRYSYSNIKKMTNGFKDKLGEGGFGTVYKGKLRSGRLVAIKLLTKPKANGQDFINEVASIGRIHHVNVVQLVGFCAEGSKRALVYDFMPNGSLDRYIFFQEGSIPLSWEKMYEISLGVAHGIEYLHRGCDIKILHFDIKPHNVLLDENFTPKVSDFGLAKLYPIDDSIVSLTMARGTIGYIAPELFYKDIGGISYKADVYSFGMLLMEIAGRRKNLNAQAEHTSQIYFPLWVYDQIDGGKDIDIGDATEEEKIIVEKIIIVALWCIQLKPSSRPSMNEVVEMLEGDLECLQMPPKPFLYPQEMPEKDVGTNTNPTESSTVANDSKDSISLEMPVTDAGMETNLTRSSILSSVSKNSVSLNVIAN